MDGIKGPFPDNNIEGRAIGVLLLPPAFDLCYLIRSRAAQRAISVHEERIDAIAARCPRHRAFSGPASCHPDWNAGRLDGLWQKCNLLDVIVLSAIAKG